MLEMVEIKVPAKLASLYALTDRERFPASQLADGLEREDTLFYADFSVAEPFGKKAVEDTFKRADFKNRGYKAVTELAAVMNHKCWEWYAKFEALMEKGKHVETDAEANALLKRAAHARGMSIFYEDRYHEVCAWAGENLKGDEATFFYSVLD